MDVLTLLIADGDENFRHALSRALQESFYVRTCCTGDQALELLRGSPVHILVVDLMLPQVDGLTLLETLCRESICPEVLVLAPDLPAEAARRMEELDIRYFLRKPFPLSAAVGRIQRLRRELQGQNLTEKRTRQILRQLHILPKYDGHRYLLHTLPMLIADPGLTITKHLYADTARDYGCTSGQVEHSIRHAIEVTWDNHRNLAWGKLFPNHTQRPSNGVFLQTIALEVRKNLE